MKGIGRTIDIQNQYSYVTPVLYRFKDKYWEPFRGNHKDLRVWHRTDGPATINHEKRNPVHVWVYMDKMVSITKWCKDHGVDEFDISEEEALIMWSELLC